MALWSILCHLQSENSIQNNKINYGDIYCILLNEINFDLLVALELMGLYSRAGVDCKVDVC